MGRHIPSNSGVRRRENCKSGASAQPRHGRAAWMVCQLMACQFFDALRTMNVIEHLERYCGLLSEDARPVPMAKGRLSRLFPWSGDRSRDPSLSQLWGSTLGLNFHQLKSATSSQLIRHELVMLARIGAVPKNLTAVLQQVAAEAITRGYAYLRGEVIGPVGKLFAESEFTALYVFQSLLFPHRICCRWTSGVRLAHPNHNRRSRFRSS
jgi:hypothetical protein